MVKHYFILAYRKIKKNSLNVTMGCLMMIASISGTLILLMHLFNGEYLPNFQLIIIFVILFIVAMASINYFNVTSLLFLKQKPEYSLRLMVGASSFDLLFQVLVESFLRTLIATLVALAFTDIATLMVNTVTLHQISLNHDFDWRMLLFLILTIGVFNGVALVNLLIYKKKIVAGFE